MKRWFARVETVVRNYKPLVPVAVWSVISCATAIAVVVAVVEFRVHGMREYLLEQRLRLFLLHADDAVYVERVDVEHLAPARRYVPGLRDPAWCPQDRDREPPGTQNLLSGGNRF